MTEHQDTRGMFDRLLALNVAYHVLAAALYNAKVREHAEDLGTVERLAGEHIAAIDRTAPAYEHSTQSAQARGQTSIFTMLAHQAHTRRAILHHEHACTQPMLEGS